MTRWDYLFISFGFSAIAGLSFDQHNYVDFISCLVAAVYYLVRIWGAD